MRQQFLVGVCTLALAAGNAWADDNTDQVITVTATRVATPVPKIAAGVTVITREQIDARGETTLAQALSAVPGLGVVQAGGPGAQTSVFIRGANSEDVLVLLDGVPVNDPSDANGAFNFGDYTLSDVERIEVVRGPMSGLYGGSAIGGVINIITRQGSGAPKVDFTVAGGIPAQGQASATISGSTGPFDYALTGAADEEAGFDYTAKRLSVYAGVTDPFRALLGTVNLGYTPVPGTRVYLVLRAQHIDNAFPDLGVTSVFDDPNEYDHNSNYFGKLGLKSTLIGGFWTTELFIARIQNTLQFNNLLDAADPNAFAAHDVYRGNRTDVQWNNTLHLRDFSISSDTSALFGLEYSDDSANEAVNESFSGFPFLINVHASQHALAGHAGFQTTLFHRLTISTALRDDSVSGFGNALTGRIGAVLAVPEAYVNLKASFGTGFLAPSLYELYGVNNGGYVGNPKLRPEYSSGFELGPDFVFSAFGRDDFAGLSVEYFQSSVRDLINPTPDFLSEQNIGQARLSGVETELTLNPASWLSADLTYTYTRAINAATGAQLLRRPQNQGAAALTLKPYPGVTITPQVTYTGSFSDVLYANDGTVVFTPSFAQATGTLKSGTLFNLSASWKLSDHFTLFAAGKNLLNSQLEPVDGLRTPGASLLIGLRGSL